MSDCGCIYCPDCVADAQQCDQFDRTCLKCGKVRNQTFDIRKKEHLKRIESNFIDPTHLLSKAVKAIKVSIG